MNSRILGYLAVAIIAAGGVYLAIRPAPCPPPPAVDKGPRFHDEPIIIENGPITFKLNPNGKAVAGIPLGEDAYLRRPFARPAKFQAWKGTTPLCPDAGCPIYERSTSLSINLIGGRPVTLLWEDVDEEYKGTLRVQSDQHKIDVIKELHLELSDKKDQIGSIRYTGPKANGGGEVYVVKVRDKPTDDAIKIQFCSAGGACWDKK